MSRIGKKPVPVPSNVTATLAGQEVKVKGPKGELAFTVPDALKVARNGSNIEVTLIEDTKQARSMWGMSRTMITNMIKGVTDGYTKTLEIHGVGFRAAMQGKDKVQMQVGYSHDVIHPIPQGRRGQGRRRQAGSDHRSPASTSRSSASWPPSCGPIASRSPTRARACAIRANTSSARKARRSKDARAMAKLTQADRKRRSKQGPCVARQDSAARARRQSWKVRRPSAAVGVPLVAEHLRADHRRRARADAGCRLDARQGLRAALKTGANKDAAVAVGKLVAERARQGRRQGGRVRPRRLSSIMAASKRWPMPPARAD